MHYKQHNNGMYILSRGDIEEIATKTLNEYSPNNLKYPRPLDTKDFLINYLGLVIKYKYIGDFQSGILGLTVMGDIVPIPSYDVLLRPTVLEETFGTVLITPQLLSKEQLSRRRYTEMHEAAHFLLHRPYFENREKQCAARTNPLAAVVVCRKVELKHVRARTPSDWLEYQADALAAALLMPKAPFISCFRDAVRKQGVCAPRLSISPCVDAARVHKVVYDVSDAFQVSYQAAKIRLLQLGLLTETAV